MSPMVLLMVVACTCQDGGEQPTGKPTSSIGHTVPQPVGTKGRKRARKPAPRHVSADMRTGDSWGPVYEY